jgi:hypothetical protein
MAKTATPVCWKTEASDGEQKMSESQGRAGGAQKTRRGPECARQVYFDIPSDEAHHDEHRE